MGEFGSGMEEFRDDAKRRMEERRAARKAGGKPPEEPVISVQPEAPQPEEPKQEAPRPSAPSRSMPGRPMPEPPMSDIQPESSTVSGSDEPEPVLPYVPIPHRPEPAAREEFDVFREDLIEPVSPFEPSQPNLTEEHDVVPVGPEKSETKIKVQTELDNLVSLYQTKFKVEFQENTRDHLQWLAESNFEQAQEKLNNIRGILENLVDLAPVLEGRLIVFDNSTVRVDIMDDKVVMHMYYTPELVRHRVLEALAPEYNRRRAGEVPAEYEDSKYEAKKKLYDPMRRFLAERVDVPPWDIDKINFVYHVVVGSHTEQLNGKVVTVCDLEECSNYHDMLRMRNNLSAELREQLDEHTWGDNHFRKFNLIAFDNFWKDVEQEGGKYFQDKEKIRAMHYRMTQEFERDDYAEWVRGVQSGMVADTVKSASSPEAAPQPERVVYPLSAIPDLIRAELSKLKTKIGIMKLNLAPISDGVRLEAQFKAKGEDIGLSGDIVNGTDGLVIRNHHLEAGFLVKAFAGDTIREVLDNFSSQSKRYFEQQSGKPVHQIKIDGGELVVEYKTSEMLAHEAEVQRRAAAAEGALDRHAADADQQLRDRAIRPPSRGGGARMKKIIRAALVGIGLLGASAGIYEGVRYVTSNPTIETSSPKIVIEPSSPSRDSEKKPSPTAPQTREQEKENPPAAQEPRTEPVASQEQAPQAQPQEESSADQDLETRKPTTKKRYLLRPQGQVQSPEENTEERKPTTKKRYFGRKN